MRAIRPEGTLIEFRLAIRIRNENGQFKLVGLFCIIFTHSKWSVYKRCMVSITDADAEIVGDHAPEMPLLFPTALVLQ